MYISNLQISSNFIVFCVAHNIKNFVVNFFILVDYIIDYVQIYFHNFLKFKTKLFRKN
jgi:hypothetical protein